MADRIFAGFVLAIATAYFLLAIFVVKAPFQYDPLGPETWPRILGGVAMLCSLYVLIRPRNHTLEVNKATAFKLFVLLCLLSGYAYLYEPLGFIISSFLFCAGLARFLGANNLESSIFGAASAVGGYVICAMILDLNLPEGILEFIL